MRECAPGIYGLDGLRMGRSYLVEGDHGHDVALVDSSSCGCAERIIAAVEAIGRRPDDLKLIVATHYHHDHTGNVGQLRDRTGARLYVHTDDVPYVDGRAAWGSPRGQGRGTRALLRISARLAPSPYELSVDGELREGDVLPFAGGMRVLHAPGHTPGHIALHAPGRRTLFAGDSLMNVFGLQLPVWLSTHDMDEAKRTIARLATLDYDVALPGHGSPVIGRASEKIAEWSRRWL